MKASGWASPSDCEVDDMEMRIEREVGSVAEGLKKLLDKYGVTPPPYQMEGNVLKVNGEEMPLFPWREEARFREMKRLCTGGVVGEIVSIRAMRTAEKREGLENILYREIDLCLWLAGKRFKNLFAVVNGACANVILRFEGNATVILEAAATQKDGAEAAERHEVFTDHGMVNDQAIDTQVKQQSLYEFVEGKTAAYTDVDFELYGLKVDEVARVRAAYAALCGRVDGENARAEDAYVRKAVKAVFESSDARKVVSLEEEEV